MSKNDQKDDLLAFLGIYETASHDRYQTETVSKLVQLGCDVLSQYERPI